MECNRLKSLVKSWYLQMQEEALAPARMVDLMKKHASGCSVCQSDYALSRELDKIIEIILPPAKVRNKAITEAAQPVKVAEPPVVFEKNQETSPDKKQDDDDT